MCRAWRGMLRGRPLFHLSSTFASARGPILQVSTPPTSGREWVGSTARFAGGSPAPPAGVLDSELARGTRWAAPGPLLGSRPETPWGSGKGLARRRPAPPRGRAPPGRRLSMLGRRAAGAGGGGAAAGAPHRPAGGVPGAGWRAEGRGGARGRGRAGGRVPAGAGA